MIYDINETVEITLTLRGMQVILDERVRLTKAIPTEDWRTYWHWDEKGKIKMALWQVMELFGASMGLGIGIPFETKIKLLGDVKGGNGTVNNPH